MDLWSFGFSIIPLRFRARIGLGMVGLSENNSPGGTPVSLSQRSYLT